MFCRFSTTANASAQNQARSECAVIAADWYWVASARAPTAAAVSGLAKSAMRIPDARMLCCRDVASPCQS